MKIMASGPITSWQIDGESVETVTDFIFLGSNITEMVTAAMKLKDTSSLDGEGNGNQLQCSCLEHPRDGGAWWAAIYGVAQSWTHLKRLGMHACIGEGNVNPLQNSCLENPRDGGAWWAAIYGVAQSRT